MTEPESAAPPPPSMHQVVLMNPPNGMTLRYVDPQNPNIYVGSLQIEVGDQTRVLEMLDAARAYIEARQEARMQAAKPS